jgi:iron complex outermembrane receptor protein
LLGGFDTNESEWSFGEGSYGDNLQSGTSLKPRFRFDLRGGALIAGVDLLYDALDFTAYQDEARSLVPSEAELSEGRISPYLFVERELTDRLTVSGGLRHEWVHYEAENRAYVANQLSPTIETNRGPRPNPNFKDPADIDPANSYEESIRESGFSAEFSVNFRPTDALSLWAGYDRAYRYPVFDERASYQGFPLAEFIARDLEAEEGDQFELGFKWRQGEHEFYGTLYVLQMENEIIFDPSIGRDDPDTPGNGLNRNLGAVDRYGADFSYAYTRDSWGLSLAIAWVETEMQVGVDGAGAGQEVPLVPAVVATSQLWWEPWAALRLRLIHRYVADRYQGGDFANDLARAKAYQLVGASADYQLNPNCRLFLKADNLFDRRYAESVFAGSYYPGPGRSLQVGLRLDF